MRSYHPINETRSVEADPMVWPHPRDVILYARSSYYCDDMFIICLFLTLFLILKPVLVYNPKIAGTFAITLRFLTSRQHVFCLWFCACNLLYVTSPQNQVADVSLVLKDSDMDSENVSSLIRLSVSDGQKTHSSKSKQGCKDQESIQSSTTPDPGYQWESDKLTVDTTNENQEISPFPAGDHKAHINRRAQNIANTRQNKNIKDPQKKYRLGTVSKIFYWRA